MCYVSQCAVTVVHCSQTDIVERIRINHDHPPYARVTMEAGPVHSDIQDIEIRTVGARYKNAQLILLAIAHVSVAKSAADVYACVEESPGRRVMADNPEVVCFEGSWTKYE